MPKRAAMERSVSPWPTTYARTAGGCGVVTVVRRWRAWSTGRAASGAVHETTASGDRSAKNARRTRASSGIAHAVRTGAPTAIATRTVLASARGQRFQLPRLRARRRGTRNEMPNARSVPGLNGTVSSTRLLRRRGAPTTEATLVPRAISVPTVRTTDDRAITPRHFDAAGVRRSVLRAG